MKTTVPKNRIVLLILSAIAGSIILLIIGMYCINRTVQESYDEAIITYDAISDKTTDVIRQGIENKSQALMAVAAIIGQSGDLRRESLTGMLPGLVQGFGYLDMAVLDTEGKGYNISGQEVDYNGAAYMGKAVIQGQASVSDIETGDEETVPTMLYAAPIMKEGICLGVLIATHDTENDEQTIFNFDPDYKENSEIYILDEDNKPLAGLNARYNFEYSLAIKEGYLHDVGDSHESGIQLSDYFMVDKLNKEVVVWYQKPLGINNWSVLIGKTHILNPVTQNIMRITNIMWSIVLASIVVLFLMLIIFQRRSNRKLIQILYLDPVTGGDNWYKFRADVKKILNSRLFFRKKYALVNFDINRFKIINDSFGHQRGDEVLKDIHTIVKKWVKQGEPFTRYAADQYYILLTFEEEGEVTERITDLNNRLHQLKYTKTVKFYYGVYFISERKDSIDRMGDFAGKAKQNIKGSNEDTISYFDDAAKIRLLEEENIEKNMHDALKNNEFVVFLQPKYTAIEEKVSGAEALVRWNNGKNNLMPPGFFIPVFEKNGFIIELDLYMLRKICNLQRNWLDKGYIPMPVSVNISRVNFTNPHLADIIKDTVDEYQVPHKLIELELSESAFLQNKQVLINTVILLREYGFVISMDDFGAGYSSLNSLKDLPLDVVKLDGELFRDSQEANRGQTVVRNTIAMAKDLHMTVVAECIETREQVEFLCTVGCDIIQGFYYAKPMPVEQFESTYLIS